MTASTRTFAFALAVLAVAQCSIAVQVADEHHASVKPVNQGPLVVAPSSNASAGAKRPISAREHHDGTIAVLNPSIAITDEHKKVVGKVPHAPTPKSDSPSLQARGVAMQDVGVDVHPPNGLGGKHVDVAPHAHIEGGMPTPNPAPAYVPHDVVSKPVSRTSEILSLAKNATAPIAPVHKVLARDVVGVQDATHLQPTKMPLALSPGGKVSVGMDKPVLQRRQDDGGSGDDSFDPEDPYNVAGAGDSDDGSYDGDDSGLDEMDPFVNDWRRRQEEDSPEEGLLSGSSDDGGDDAMGAGALGNDGGMDGGDDAYDNGAADAQNVDGPTSTLLPDPSSGPANSSDSPSDMMGAGDDGSSDAGSSDDNDDGGLVRRIDSRWFKPVYYGSSNSKKLASRLVNVLSNNTGTPKAPKVPKMPKDDVKCIDYVHLSDRRACEKLQSHDHYDGSGKKVHDEPQDLARREDVVNATIPVPMDDGSDDAVMNADRPVRCKDYIYAADRRRCEQEQKHHHFVDDDLE